MKFLKKIFIIYIILITIWKTLKKDEEKVHCRINLLVTNIDKFSYFFKNKIINIFNNNKNNYDVGDSLMVKNCRWKYKVFVFNANINNSSNFIKIKI